MTTEERARVTPVKTAALTYVPTVGAFVALANNIFSLLGATPTWQRRIVLGLLASIPVVLALAWIFGTPKRGDGSFARATGTRSRRLAFAAVPTVFVAAALVWTIGPLAAGETKVEPRVSVVRFRDDSPQSDHAYLASGLSEELALALERVPGMQVLDSPDSAVVLIEGAVSRWKDSLRVTAKLLRNADKRRLRTVRYERPFGDVFALQDSLSREIVQELLPHIPGGLTKGAIRLRDPLPEAYDLYLRARFARDSERNVVKADSLFRAALAVDPSFARARRDLAALETVFRRLGDPR
jgi:TolB-like protein